MELTIKLRRDSAQNWTTINPVLHEGEAGVELETKKMKLGDGVTVWNSLPYVNVIPNEDITGATHTKITYDSKGLVTGGEDLSASDIPNLTLSKISDVTATAAEVNVLDGITSTTTELNQIHESNVVTSDLTKLHNITADASELNILDGATLTTAELNYVDGVTSNIQTQLNGKQPTITGAATSIVSSNLTASRVLVSNASGKVAADANITTTELGYLDGVTSNIQTQLNNKVNVKPDGTNDLITNNKVADIYLPDYLFGQMIYAGGFVPSTAVATLTTNAKKKLGTQSDTITLTNDTTPITGYAANEGCYYICTADGTFAGVSLLTGDWLVSTGSAWTKVDNTDAVTGVKGNAETTYRLGNVNITIDNVAPDQANNSGKVLTTNGTNASWNALPVSDVTVNGTSVVSDGTASITVPTNYVTTDTAQEIAATKTFTAQQRIQSGQTDGCLIIGADVGDTTLTDGTRKLGRLGFPTNEDSTLNCAFVSCDTQAATSGQVIQNCAEFGGRVGDRTSTSPDVINFTVATEHNTLDSAKKKLVLAIDKNAANFTAEPQYNGSPLVTTDTTQTITSQKIFQTTSWDGGLTAKRSGTLGSYILFSNTNGNLGVIGIQQNEIPLFIDKDNTEPRAIVRAGIYSTSTGSDASVGDATTPVYIDSSGIATACSFSIPSQTDNNGKVLRTDGTNTSWGYSAIIREWQD